MRKTTRVTDEQSENRRYRVSLAHYDEVAMAWVAEDKMDRRTSMGVTKIDGRREVLQAAWA